MHWSWQVRFVNCRFMVDPTVTALCCKQGSEAEAHGCLFENISPAPSRPGDTSTQHEDDWKHAPAVRVYEGGSFSAKHCVWRGLPLAVLAHTAKASLQECLICTQGAMLERQPCLWVGAFACTIPCL